MIELHYISLIIAFICFGVAISMQRNLIIENFELKEKLKTKKGIITEEDIKAMRKVVLSCDFSDDKNK